MKKIIETFSKANKILKYNENLYEIETNAVVNRDFKVRVFIKKDGNSYIFTDNKTILKYMNEMYDFKSNDVKKCIADVLKIYNFTLSKGEIFTLVSEKDDLKKVYNDFIMCAAQLINMFVFFDEA